MRPLVVRQNDRLSLTLSCLMLALLSHVEASNGRIPACGERTGRVDSWGLSAASRHAVLAGHNALRSMVAAGRVTGLPKSASMATLQWDDELEREAEKWAKLCPSAFDGTSHPPELWKSKSYGQNVAWSYPDWNSTLIAWFDEYKPYVAAGVDPLIFRDSSNAQRRRHNLGQIAHFTAMVNAKSNRLGCSQAGGDEYKMRMVYVCNYAPPGNLMVRSADGSLTPVPAYEAVDQHEQSVLFSDQPEPTTVRSQVGRPLFRKMKQKLSDVDLPNKMAKSKIIRKKISKKNTLNLLQNKKKRRRRRRGLVGLGLRRPEARAQLRRLVHSLGPPVFAEPRPRESLADEKEQRERGMRPLFVEGSDSSEDDDELSWEDLVDENDVDI